jgi:uncharacterized protein (DUF1778 family)
MPAAITSRKDGKHERLEARITASQRRLLERAAKLRGTSVADFVVHSVRQAANGDNPRFRGTQPGPGRQ